MKKISPMDPCRLCGQGEPTVYQSPIALSHKCKTIFTSDPQLKQICSKVFGIFDPETKNWNVSNIVETSNNDLHYRLKEFHFHIAGEHTINDKKYASEIHFVFVNAENTSILVIGYVIELHKKSSKVIEKIIRDIPFSFPKIRPYYTYPGSLTTPPFNVNVNWIVVSKPLSITEANLEALLGLAKGERPLQPRNGRDIIYTQCH
jgi:carbonic anhydrase